MVAFKDNIFIDIFWLLERAPYLIFNCTKLSNITLIKKTKKYRDMKFLHKTFNSFYFSAAGRRR